MRRLATLAVLGLVLPALAQDTPAPQPPSTPQPPAPAPATPLARALAALRDAHRGEHAAGIEKVLGLTDSVEEVTGTIRAGLPPPETKAGWHVLTARDGHGEVERPYHLYIPESVAASPEPVPLLIDMHGGVSRPEFIDEASFEGRRTMWQETADANGFVLACPLGRADCMWWSDAGVRHVRSVVRDAKRYAPIDSDRIVATGFSDGASGCYYLAMAAPQPFAAMIPMNGHPLVAVGASERQLYLRNVVAMPLFVCMTQDDGLYPAQTVLPHIQALIREGASVHLVSYPTGGHSPSYLEDQQEALGGFVMSAMRDPLPDRFEWATAHVETGATSWIEILQIQYSDDDISTHDVPDIQVMSTEGRVMIGIGVDRDFTGEGVRVTSVRDGTPAAELDLFVGDVITAVDGIAVKNLADLRKVLSGIHFGENMHVRWRREGQPDTLEKYVLIPEFTPQPTYTREKDTAWMSVVRDGNTVNVSSAYVGRFRLHLSDALFDLSAPVVVNVNGVERARQMPEPDLRRVVNHWAAGADPGVLFSCFVDVSIPFGIHHDPESE